MKYPRLTKDQLEVWLNDPATRCYLKALLATHSRKCEAIGNGAMLDRSSMENTYGGLREAEGVKFGLDSAMDVVGRLREHELLEEVQEGEAEVVMPEIEVIEVAI